MSAVEAKGIPLQVLLVEDSPGDVRLTREAFREANRHHRDPRRVGRRRGDGLPAPGGRIRRLLRDRT